MYCTFLIVSLHENAIPKHQKINLIAGLHCTYFNVSHLETNIRAHQQIDPLAGWYCNYLNVSRPKMQFLKISKQTPLQFYKDHLNVFQLQNRIWNIGRTTNFQDNTNHI